MDDVFVMFEFVKTELFSSGGIKLSMKCSPPFMAVL